MKMINGYHFKIADDTKAELVKALIYKVFNEFGLEIYPHATLDIEKNEEAYRGGFFGLIYNADEKLVGTFGLYKLSKKTAEIRKMYLLPKARGNGLGKWMVQFLLNKAKDLGFEKVELETSSSFIAAMELYRKMGFQQKDASKLSSACNRAFFMELS